MTLGYVRRWRPAPSWTGFNVTSQNLYPLVMQDVWLQRLVPLLQGFYYDYSYWVPDCCYVVAAWFMFNCSLTTVKQINFVGNLILWISRKGSKFAKLNWCEIVNVTLTTTAVSFKFLRNQVAIRLAVIFNLQKKLAVKLTCFTVCNERHQVPDSETSLMPVFFSSTCFRPSGADALDMPAGKQCKRR